MRKQLTLVLALVSTIASFAQDPEILYDFMSDGVAYKILDEYSVEISPVSREWKPSTQTGQNEYFYTGNDVEFLPTQRTVTNEVDGREYNIVGIGAYAFFGNTKIRSLLFDMSYTGFEYIGQYAFYDCQSLKVVSFPKSIKLIEESAFERCMALKYIAFGFAGEDGIFEECHITLREGAFYDDVALEGIFLNNSVSLELPATGDAFLKNSDDLYALQTYVPNPNAYEIQNLSRYHLKNYGEFGRPYLRYTGKTPELNPFFDSYVPDVIGNVVQAYPISNGNDTYNAGEEYNAFGFVNFNFGAEYDFFNLTVRLIFPFSLQPAPMTIAVSESSREYGNPNPSFEITVSGYVNGENESIFATKPFIADGSQYGTPDLPTESSAVGEYQINAFAVLSYPQNYEIRWIPGNLTITPAPLKVLVNDAARPFGEKNPQFSADFEGFKNGETKEVLLEAPQFSTDAGIDSPVGDYPIVAMGGKAENYTLSYQNGTLSILKADQHVIWSQEFDNMKVGDEVTLDATVSSGLPVEYTLYNNNNVAELNGNVIRFIGAGEVDIEVTQPGNENYNSFAMFKTAHVSSYSGVGNVTAENSPNIRIVNGEVIITDTEDSDMVCIYSISGNIIYRGTSRAIPLPDGIYIIQIGNLREKTVVW